MSTTFFFGGVVVYKLMERNISICNRYVKKKCIVAEVVDLELAPPRGGGKVGRES